MKRLKIALFTASIASITVAFTRYKFTDGGMTASYCKTDFTKFLEHKGMFKLLQNYNPPFLTTNPHLSMILGQVLHQHSHLGKSRYQRSAHLCESRGTLTFDIAKSHPDSKKLILILPGVTGCSDDRYI
jgi:predicted alpha/beta-fold hydrolase